MTCQDGQGVQLSGSRIPLDGLKLLQFLSHYFLHVFATVENTFYSPKKKSITIFFFKNTHYSNNLHTCVSLWSRSVW